MRIYKEEIFGPVLCVVRAPDFDDAVRMVNAHEYGNGAAIFTRDGDAARDFATRVNIGMVGVNVPIPVPMAFHSFGGWKRSLFGDHHIHGTGRRALLHPAQGRHPALAHRHPRRRRVQHPDHVGHVGDRGGRGAASAAKLCLKPSDRGAGRGETNCAMSTGPLPIFDGHNDTLLRLLRKNLPICPSSSAARQGHLDLPRARAGRVRRRPVRLLRAVGRPRRGPAGPGARRLRRAVSGHARPRPGARVTVALAARLERLARESEGPWPSAARRRDIRRRLAAGTLAAVLHIEGAEAIDPELEALDVLYAAGLRSLGPVWSRPNIFGHGVPFRFPSPPDTGPGLTEAGKALIKACNELRIMLDLSHLNEAGFWDVAALSDAPLVATHSNAHALCPCSRNLTDRQLDAIRESGGVVGLNLAVSFLRADGRNDADTPVETLVAHVDHLVERLGIDGVALGTDFDGCTVPACIRRRGRPAGADRGPAGARLRRARRCASSRTRTGWRVLERTWGG